MPSTSNGTAYTVTTSTTTGYGTCLVAVADAHRSDQGIPTILYAHGSGGAYNQFMTLAAWTTMREWLIDGGCAIVEGGGGLTDSAGAENWGNPDSGNAYIAYLEWADTQIDIGPVVPFGRSMGGIVVPRLYLDSSISSRCAGLLVNSGVQTLTYGTVGSDTTIRPTWQFFGTKVFDAYGATNQSTFTTLSHDCDPMNLDPALWNGSKVLQLVGDADDAVPRAIRGCDPLRAIYSGRPAADLYDVRIGGDHSATNGSYLQAEAMTSFLSGLGFGAATTPETQSYSIESIWLVTTLGATQCQIELPN